MLEMCAAAAPTRLHSLRCFGDPPFRVAKNQSIVKGIGVSEASEASFS